MPASRSTSCHRRPSASPWRRPVASESRTRGSIRSPRSVSVGGACWPGSRSKPRSIMSSSYDAAMVDTAMIEDPRLLCLPRGSRLLYLEMLVWAKLRRTDGHVPLGALSRLTDEPDPIAAATKLAYQELLRTDQEIGGFWIVDFAASQWTAEQVQRRIESQREARERYEERHPNRPRSGSRDKLGERSRDGSHGPTDVPTDRPTE